MKEYFPESGPWKQYMAFFGHRYPLPGHSVFFHYQAVTYRLHDASPLTNHPQGTGEGAGGFGIITWMISMTFPHARQVIPGRCLRWLLNLPADVTRSTIWRNLISFLLHAEGNSGTDHDKKETKTPKRRRTLRRPPVVKAKTYPGVTSP